jgi:hypothetical protein
MSYALVSYQHALPKHKLAQMVRDVLFIVMKNLDLIDLCRIVQTDQYCKQAVYDFDSKFLKLCFQFPKTIIFPLYLCKGLACKSKLTLHRLCQSDGYHKECKPDLYVYFHSFNLLHFMEGLGSLSFSN